MLLSATPSLAGAAMLLSGRLLEAAAVPTASL